jgi:hypothetical protein
MICWRFLLTGRKLFLLSTNLIDSVIIKTNNGRDRSTILGILYDNFGKLLKTYRNNFNVHVVFLIRSDDITPVR